MERIYNESGEILKAGAIVYRNHGKEFLLTHRFSQDDYSFPKGHLELNETFEVAAAREVLEETGCMIRIVKPLTDISYSYPESDKVRVKMFLAECLSQGKNSEPNEESIWARKEEISSLLTYDNLKEYFENVTEALTL